MPVCRANVKAPGSWWTNSRQSWWLATNVPGTSLTGAHPVRIANLSGRLVAVAGRRAERVEARDALSYVAGYAVGQDISERVLQMAATPPQFSLGKSLPGFGPIGPWLVTLDEFADPNDLELGCAINGEQVQLSRTSELIFSVPVLVSRLS